VAAVEHSAGAVPGGLPGSVGLSEPEHSVLPPVHRGFTLGFQAPAG
jgi:hypothetical protein